MLCECWRPWWGGGQGLHPVDRPGPLLLLEGGLRLRRHVCAYDAACTHLPTCSPALLCLRTARVSLCSVTVLAAISGPCCGSFLCVCLSRFSPKGGGLVSMTDVRLLALPVRRGSEGEGAYCVRASMCLCFFAPTVFCACDRMVGWGCVFRLGARGAPGGGLRFRCFGGCDW